MKLSKAEYEEMIRKKPSLRPTEVTPNIGGAIAKAYGHSLAIKSQNTHRGFVEELTEKLRAINAKIGPEWENRPEYPIVQEKAVKTISSGLGTVSFLNPIQSPNSHQDALKVPKTLCFTIPGQPVGKPRQTRADKWKKRPCVMRYREWADRARASVPSGAILSTYRQITFVAYLEIPKSYSMTRRHILAGNPHYQKPDGDNILKSILDALFPEDKVIWKFSGEKRWDDGRGPRIEVELR